MFAVAYRKTMAGAKRIASEAKFVRRDNVVSISLEWRRREEKRAAEEAERQERIRSAIAKEKARWAQIVENQKIKAPRKRYEEIIAMVCAWHEVDFDEVMGASRRVPVAAARQDAFAAVWFNCRLENRRPNLTSMGRAFNRDHTTILFGLRKVGAILRNKEA